jgi:hypothetical protein
VGLPEQERNEEVMEHMLLTHHITFPPFSRCITFLWKSHLLYSITERNLVSEVAKKREALQKRLGNVQRWAEGARKRMHNASTLYNKRCELTKERARELSRVLVNHQITLEQQGMDDWLLRKTIKEEKATADAEIEEYEQRQWKAYHTSNKEFAKTALLTGWKVLAIQSARG